MKCPFRPGELREWVSLREGGLEFLSCRRLELGGEIPAVVIGTGLEEVVLVCIAGQFDYDIGEVAGTARFNDML